MRVPRSLTQAVLVAVWLPLGTGQADEPSKAATVVPERWRDAAERGGSVGPATPSVGTPPVGLSYEAVIDLRDASDPQVCGSRDAVIHTEPDGTMYWAPRHVRRPAEIVYRIDLPAPIEAIVSSNIRTAAYNENHESGHAYDLGCSAELYVSVDGRNWIELQTNYPGAPRTDRDLRDIPELIGAHTLYFRARLLVTKSHPRGFYRYSQFLRSNPDWHDFERIALILRDSSPNRRSGRPTDATVAAGSAAGKEKTPWQGMPRGR